MTNDERRYLFSVYFLFHLRFISSFFVFSPIFVLIFSSRIFRVYHRSVPLSSFFFCSSCLSFFLSLQSYFTYLDY